MELAMMWQVFRRIDLVINPVKTKIEVGVQSRNANSF